MARKIAEKKKGHCVSNEYINTTTKLKWRCASGHEWDARFHSVKSGSWCAICAGLRRLTLEDARSSASAKSGKCISDKFSNSKSMLIWECKYGHQWHASYDRIRAGKWCMRCAQPGRFRTLEDVKVIAKNRGGECLSSKYRGGECLSSKYLGGEKHLRWRCKYGHVWRATPRDIVQDRWCKSCSIGFMERVCREYFEQIFKKPFPNVRLDWFVNPKTNQRLELDGYNEKLGIAFEYHGQHHLRFNSLFHKSKKDLKDRKMLDNLKRKLIDEQGVKIIYIPQMPTFLKLEDLLSYLESEFIRLKIEYPKDLLSLKIDLKRAYAPEESKYNKLLHEVALRRGGKFLSPSYLGVHVKVDFECSEGHKWSAAPAKVVLMNRWCPYCAKVNKRNSTEKIKNELEEYNIEFLDKYKSVQARLKAKCKKCSLTWETSLALIRERKNKYGFVCLKCAGKRLKNEPELLMPFKEARKFVRSLNLKNQKEGQLYVRGKRPDLPPLPFNIPMSPYKPYKNKGFKGIGDWLGTDYIALSKRVYRPFKEARKFARSLGLKSSRDWLKYIKGELPQLPKLPEDIPKYPNDCRYVNEGWKSWADWLGY